MGKPEERLAPEAGETMLTVIGYGRKDGGKPNN
jgi:hypothetical protein